MSQPYEEMRKLLSDAQSVVGDRGDQYGTPIDDFKRIAAMWNAIRPKGEYEPHHVAMYMMCLKLSRMTHSPGVRDHWLDVNGYSSCGWACVTDAGEQEIPDVVSGRDYKFTINNTNTLSKQDLL